MRVINANTMLIEDSKNTSGILVFLKSNNKDLTKSDRSIDYLYCASKIYTSCAYTASLNPMRST